MNKYILSVMLALSLTNTAYPIFGYFEFDRQNNFLIASHALLGLTGVLAYKTYKNQEFVRRITVIKVSQETQNETKERKAPAKIKLARAANAEETGIAQEELENARVPHLQPRDHEPYRRYFPLQKKTVAYGLGAATCASVGAWCFYQAFHPNTPK